MLCKKLGRMGLQAARVSQLRGKLHILCLQGEQAGKTP